MKTVNTIDALRHTVSTWRCRGERIAFVPTMGNLHDGHLALIDEAKKQADRTVASIFVNPLQFGEGEDFETYPRTMAEDSSQLASRGVDLLFAPSVEVMYPQTRQQQTRVEVPDVSHILDGEFRPGFFVGVATVVCKLFNMVQPDIAVFGEKDFQQLHIIRRMVKDLQMPIEIAASPTVRESDGLAMSSRNSYLDAQQRKTAPLIYRSLLQAAGEIERGEDDYAQLERVATATLEDAGFVVDYFTLRNTETLNPVNAGESNLVILTAARLGQTRLIDNIVISQ
ncbi:MAG: pantoate--beta-alanine ligase [Gammaproteobacteria bacterium]|nr:pantoate--beta-alanine ligase [Gammaproteobacteria bacterium]